MIGNKSPSVAPGPTVLKNAAEPIHKIVPVFVVAEYLPPFQPPEYDVMKGSRSINS
jgi:hypothetical protein